MLDFLDRLGIGKVNSGAWAGAALDVSGGELLDSENPTTGETIARIQLGDSSHYEKVVATADQAFLDWRMLPAPKRGEIVRQMAEKLREHKEDLGKLVTLEMGKILTEGLGEVQEAIDMADFCVGLSRQLYGLSMHSERARHRMYEQWHPLGTVGVITAFNFPVAVWAWNAMVALACGDAVVWKPSSKTPLCGIATHKLMNDVLAANGWEGVLGMMVGDRHVVGNAMNNDRRLPLISATGSTAMGISIGKDVIARLGRTILELGGNNGIIVQPDADLDMTLRAVLFGAVGTAGQRCTSTRRLFLHKDIAGELTEKLVSAYGSIRIGDPMDPSTLMGPLVDRGAVRDYAAAMQAIREQGGEVLCGGEVIDGPGHFVQPTIVRARHDMPICHHETFAPILYIFEHDDLAQAIAWHNEVPQGLSSSIFTDSFRSAETFLSHAGSDCGIANVNIGTSGAEIGGAFGGEKETGGGREAGSDCWKTYMRRQTCTLNWGTELPLAQGVSFDL